MRKFIAGFLVLLVVVAVGAAGVFTYSFANTSPVTLIVYMSSDESPAAVKWGAEKAFYGLHPTEDEVQQLNTEAGARYAALYPDKAEARKLLKHFLENGVDVNAVDTATGSGVSALHSAVLERSPFAVDLLLEHGANPAIQGEQGRTPLDFARLLQEKEAGPDIAKIIAALENL
ncbi:ankyrin repeat domain-containing protein [Marinobacter zhanjiangensis]|uniref:Ankyrin repeat-containing protein n=1 Tax=Marinobacter zhanjiangensis TaxID=578215 RepID=A0ABQ3BAK2_9GAMM|nr:ankyrin repeat domain-containing protein [Marinobacter zhanjiangensis]GGY81525.1 hypothetical protein GCM10007071_31200 [Marinobacter zhanjiangensis]